MDRSVALLLVLLFIAAFSVTLTKPALSSPDALAENSWVTKMPMHEARAYPGVAVINGKIYVIGGDVGVMVELLPATDLSYDFVSTNEEYDPAGDNWTLKAPMPTARALFGTAVYQNKIYCVGGYISGKTTGVNEVYNPATNTWETKTPMPRPMYGVQANTVNSKIYFAGINSHAIYAYDPQTDFWESKTAAPYGIVGRVSGVFGNKIYFIGAITNSSGVRIGICIQAYDTVTDSWTIVITTSPTVTTDYPTFNLGTTGGSTSGVIASAQIYFFDKTQTNIYNLENDSWTVGVTIPSSRICASVAVINDIFFIIGGRVESQWGDPRLLHLGMFPSNLTGQYTPVGFRTILPVVSVVSPVNETYNVSSVPLTFTIDRLVFLMEYCLDGRDNGTIVGNSTLAGLSDGVHNVTVYAEDNNGNIGASVTVTFNVAKEPEPFPTIIVATASGASVALVAVGLFWYFRKHNR